MIAKPVEEQVPTWTGPLGALREELRLGAYQSLGRWWKARLTTGLLVAGRVRGARPSLDGGLEVRLAAKLAAAQGRLPLKRRAQWESEALLVARALDLTGWVWAPEPEKWTNDGHVVLARLYTEGGTQQ